MQSTHSLFTRIHFKQSAELIKRILFKVGSPARRRSGKSIKEAARLDDPIRGRYQVAEYILKSKSLRSGGGFGKCCQIPCGSCSVLSNKIAWYSLLLSRTLLKASFSCASKVKPIVFQSPPVGLQIFGFKYKLCRAKLSKLRLIYNWQRLNKILICTTV